MSYPTNHHPLLALLPIGQEDFILRPPSAGSGVHQWMCSAAHVTYPFLTAKEQIELLHWAVARSGRAPGPNEIEKTVYHVRDWRESGRKTNSAAWPKPDFTRVNQLVLNGPTKVEFSEQSIIRPLSGDPAYWVNTLFSGDPLLCLSQEIWDPRKGEIARHWTTKPKSQWPVTDRYSLIVPNEAQAKSGLTQDGRPSRRCGEMFPARRYLVLEMDFSILDRSGTHETEWAAYIRHWQLRGRSVQDACAAVIHHLREYGPLVLVLWSGGKSLHAWFRTSGAPEKEVLAFMKYAVLVGADRATWSKCQLVRLPAGRRTSNGNRQEVLFFDPSQLP
jgi:hypothetical protein